MSNFPEPEYVMCPNCDQEMPWWGDALGDQCPHCRAVVTEKPVDPEPDHSPISLEGWTCDTCGVSVNGQTDEDGRPIHDGWVVKHIGTEG